MPSFSLLVLMLRTACGAPMKTNGPGRDHWCSGDVSFIQFVADDLGQEAGLDVDFDMTTGAEGMGAFFEHRLRRTFHDDTAFNRRNLRQLKTRPLLKRCDFSIARIRMDPSCWLVKKTRKAEHTRRPGWLVWIGMAPMALSWAAAVALHPGLPRRFASCVNLSTDL
jgi:hypothetical protein